MWQEVTGPSTGVCQLGASRLSCRNWSRKQSAALGYTSVGGNFAHENSCLSLKASFLQLSSPAGKVKGGQENKDEGIRCGWYIEPCPNPGSLTNFLHKQNTQITTTATKRSGEKAGGTVNEQGWGRPCLRMALKWPWKGS